VNQIFNKTFISILLLSSYAFSEEGNFIKLCEKRHSGYVFDGSRAVSKEQMIRLAESASLCPSSYNEQPWRFIFCDKILTQQAYEKALESLVEPNRKWAKEAPLLIIVLTDNLSSTNQQLNRFSEYDTGSAVISLIYEATEQGLMTHQMGGYDVEKIKKTFSLPNNLTPLAIIAIGYEKANKPLAEKKRRAIGESFFLGGINHKLN